MSSVSEVMLERGWNICIVMKTDVVYEHDVIIVTLSCVMIVDFD